MVELSCLADSDIEAIITRSGFDFGTTQTKRYITSLKRCMEMLGDNPAMGNRADDIAPGLRRFPHRSHIVIYREIPNGALVLRVLHRSMDIGERFK